MPMHARAGMGVFKKGYPKKPNPQNEKTVPFHKLLPLELQDHVSGKMDKAGESVCLQEMALLFTCLKTADFRNSACMEELTTYNKCYFSNMEAKKALKEELAAGKLTPNTRDQRRLNHRQLNMLLKKFPQYNYREPKK